MSIPNKLVVCPTSHMDWDWNYAFEEYYKTDPSPTNSGEAAVQVILETALGLTGQTFGYCYSLAELAWLQRLAADLPRPLSLPGSFAIYGGAITSPDDIVCDGEVFVRTYLVGRRWLADMDLSGHVLDICWVPDDFGHDPQLPATLTAMGLGAVGFARVPGAFPNYETPLDSSTPSLAAQLITGGVAFDWTASDGSSVFAHFMPWTYGVPFWNDGPTGNAATWQQLVDSSFLQSNYPDIQAVQWPGDVAFAPAGGDFSLPSIDWLTGVSSFDDLDLGCTGGVGTFGDYVDAVRASGATLAAQPMDASNFWTGFFSSRPALKILQRRASIDLLATETASAPLRFGSPLGTSALDALDQAVFDTWVALAPSSHHDFITGTSPDRVYKMEQYPRLAMVADQARDLRRRAVKQLAELIVPTDPWDGPIGVAFNAVGAQRVDGLVEVPRRVTAQLDDGTALKVQPTRRGTLVQVPSVDSLGYQALLLTGDDARAPVREPIEGDTVTLASDTLEITLDRCSAWGITAIALTDGSNLLGTGQVANQIAIYDDTGNLYQMGNEPGTNGSFTPAGNQPTAGNAHWIEKGPLRWTVEAQLAMPDGSTATLTYTLHAGESLIRMRFRGSAASNTCVLTCFPAGDAKRLTYATPHHWQTDAVPAYWSGPLFKATHGWLMPSPAGSPLAAIYHQGMPAWSCEDGTIRGILVRSADGIARGAAGTDPDTHTQDYALRISETPLDPSQGTPLIESLAFRQPLRGAIASSSNSAECPITLGPSGSLASTTAPALVRVTRPMSTPRGAAPNGANVTLYGAMALRIYRPDADGTETDVTVDLPIVQSKGLSATPMTALEDPLPFPPLVAISGTTLTVPTTGALTTVQVVSRRPTTIPWNGKPPDPNGC